MGSVPSESLSAWELLRPRDLRSTLIYEPGIVESGSWVDKMAKPNAGSPQYVVTDETVDVLYGESVMSALTRAGLQSTKLVVAPGERTKSLDTYTALASRIAAIGLDTTSSIVALGGGVVLNLAGLLASTLHRGIRLVHLPTTLMAQIDVGVDFKQAINGPTGKNQIGSYYAASLVVVDPHVLRTLSAREVASGLAEAIKHALAEDQTLLEQLRRYPGMQHDEPLLDLVSKRTITLKATGLAESRLDGPKEMAAQYGHAVGHAIEFLAGGALLHGEAIAIGMCVMAEVAFKLGVCERATVQLHYDLLQAFGLPTRVPDEIGTDAIARTMRSDKHFAGEQVNVGIVKAPGHLWEADGSFAFPLELGLAEAAIATNRGQVKPARAVGRP